jgi:hypothetical protein
MAINLLIQSTTTGETLDISTITNDISWTTYRRGKAEELKVRLVNDESFKIDEGSIVRFSKDGTDIFFGYVFKIQEKYQQINLTCYSQLRYLKNKETYVFKSKTATDIVQKICNDFELETGALVDTSYKIPAMVEDIQTLLDISTKALDLTLIGTGEMYYLWDDFGKIRISNVKESLLTLQIGDDSLMKDFELQRDIATDTFNKIKLVRDNKSSGKRDVYITQDSGNIAKWGILQYQEKVNEKMNSAQINQRLNALSQTKNRIYKKLKLSCIGELSIRAGVSFFVKIGRIDLNTRLLCESCKHTFSNGQHNMSLEVRVI